MNGSEKGQAMDWEPPGRPRRRPGRIVFWVLFALAVVVVGTGARMAAGSVRTYTDPGGGMEPTIDMGSHLLVAPGPQVRRGDVVVFTRPGGAGTYVKRVIALPGDHVECCSFPGDVTVNGKPLNETYVYSPISIAPKRFSATLGRGQMWVMGDYRDVSLDSRYWGPVPTSGIIGRVVSVGSGLPTRMLRTPRTFVQNGLAPPDHRIAAYQAWLLLALAGLLAVIILGITGTIRFVARRRRARRSGRGPGGAASPGPPRLSPPGPAGRSAGGGAG
jgi:signal peptidase I